MLLVLTCPQCGGYDWTMVRDDHDHWVCLHCHCHVAPESMVRAVKQTQKKYDVTILETLRKTISVPADSREEAERKAEDMVGCGMLTLDPVTDHYETYCEGMLVNPDKN